MKSADNNSEHLIITAFKNGKPEATDYIYKKYYKQLVYFADSCINNTEEARDPLMFCHYVLASGQENDTSRPLMSLNETTFLP